MVELYIQRFGAYSTHTYKERDRERDREREREREPQKKPKEPATFKRKTVYFSAHARTLLNHRLLDIHHIHKKKWHAVNSFI